MKKILLTLLCIVYALGGYAQVKKNVTAKKATAQVYKLRTSLDSASYAYGLNLLYATSKRRSVKLTQDLKERGLTTLNYTALAKAIADELNDSTPLLTPEQSKTAVGNYLKTKYVANVTASNKFLADNKTKPGVVTLPDGLQYIVITPGSGSSPKLTDTVTAHYSGTNAAGKEF
jgi:FKBP-type peptidyl-prolyl cis-trans isomerase FklB